jgi:hypothetical protein
MTSSPAKMLPMSRASLGLVLAAVVGAVGWEGGAMGNDPSSAPAGPAGIPWQWRDVKGAAEHEPAVDVGGNARVGLVRGRDRAITGIERTDAAGRKVWSAPLPGGGTPTSAAALLMHDGTVYAALFSETATGAEVVALDAATGKVRFRSRLQGLGPLHHSKYRNSVQLRFIDPWVVAFGDESAGRYIEALDANSGATVSSRRVRP